MTQRDYIAIAEMLGKVRQSDVIDTHDAGEKVFDMIVGGLADIMKQDNERFKRNLFIAVSNNR